MIRGVAGSGKTLVLTYRAKYLAEFFPNLKVLILCYNKVLSMALAKEVAGSANVEVKTVDSIAYTIPRPPKASGKGSRPDFEETREKAALAVKQLQDGSKYDIVLVDEAQDLDRSGLDLAYGLLKKGHDDFIMALDSAQNIYRRRFTWNPQDYSSREDLRAASQTTKTREILDFAFRFLTRGVPIDDLRSLEMDPEAIVPPEAASRTGPSPVVLTCADGEEEARQVASQVDRLLVGGVDPTNIAVLYGSQKVQNRLYYAFVDRDLAYFNVTWGKNRSRGCRGDRCTCLDNPRPERS